MNIKIGDEVVLVQPVGTKDVGYTFTVSNLDESDDLPIFGAGAWWPLDSVALIRPRSTPDQAPISYLLSILHRVEGVWQQTKLPVYPKQGQDILSFYRDLRNTAKHELGVDPQFVRLEICSTYTPDSTGESNDDESGPEGQAGI